MKGKMPALLVLACLIAVQLACNLPGQSDNESQLPAPDQTLTALFAVTPNSTPTPTLPPVVTATQSGGGTPTATQPGLPTSTNTLPAAATATNTPPASGPQATATIPNMRPRGGIVARFMNTPPTIDGDWAEWKDIAIEYPATNVVFGSENWTGPEDLAGSFYVGWDNTNLYIAVKVRDDQYVQNATGQNIFQGDSIEILLDSKLQEDFYFTQLSADDFQHGVSPGFGGIGGAMETYLWFPSSIAGPRTGISMAASQQSGIYRVEAAIPWTVFEVTPANGMHLGFTLSISDNDNTGSNVQQSMVSNVSGRRLTDPTTWGDLQLVR